MTTNRLRPDRGWVNQKTHPRGPNGRGLCRFCGAEVPKGSRTFCNAAEVHEWKLRTQPAYLREQTWRRDHGICSACGVDTDLLRKEAATLSRLDRVILLRAKGFCPTATLWQADHIVPVSEGGGQCGIDNIRTLCHPCHATATAALRKRLAANRAKP